MAVVRNGDYEIYYEVMGDRSTTPLVLINGFTTQCVGSPPGFLDAVVEAGFFVVKFDNRDVGLSTKSAPGQHYRLVDMASDVVALLDAIGVDRTHVWGQSMGGMIAQTFAFTYPERCASLCSVMSTTGEAGVGNATPEALEVLMTAPPSDRDGYIAQCVATGRVFAGATPDDEWETYKASVQYDRCYWPRGSAHQMTAIRKSGSRADGLRTITCPTTVIHGRTDPLIQPSGGEATARAIPGAKLVMLEHMGHTLPPRYWPQYVAELVELRERSLRYDFRRD